LARCHQGSLVPHLLYVMEVDRLNLHYAIQNNGIYKKREKKKKLCTTRKDELQKA